MNGGWNILNIACVAAGYGVVFVVYSARLSRIASNAVATRFQFKRGWLSLANHVHVEKYHSFTGSGKYKCSVSEPKDCPKIALKGSGSEPRMAAGFWFGTMEEADGSVSEPRSVFLGRWLGAIFAL